MAIEHVDITDPNIHEPKGVAAASAGDAYVADGLGSGAWTPVQIANAACLKASSTGDTTGVTTSYQVLNNATLGGTITWTENTALNLTTDTTSGFITIADTGLYNVSYIAVIEPATNGSVFSFTFGLDSGSGAVSQESFVFSEVRTAGTTDTYTVVINCLPTITAGDDVYIMVKEASGNEFTLVSSTFVITRVL